MKHVSRKREYLRNGTVAFHFENSPKEMQCDQHGYALFVPAPESDDLNPRLYIHRPTGKRYSVKTDLEYMFPITLKPVYYFTSVN